MANIQLPNTPAYKARIEICETCEHRKVKQALGLAIPVCGVCNCPIKNKCVIGPCPKGKWS